MLHAGRNHHGKTDENHLAGVTVSRAALESLQASIGRLLREMDEEES